MTSRRQFLSSTAFSAASLALAPLIRAEGESGRKLNFVFILIDDLGWADVGCYGSRFNETPNIDRLAAQGMKFTDAYAACPVCSPTRASILTGKYPARLHLTDWLVGTRWAKDSKFEPNRDWQKFLPLEEVTIAEVLQRAGYVTGHVGKWHLGEKIRPEEQGFDVNVGGGRWGSPPSYFAPYKNPTIADGLAGEYLTDRLGDEAVKFIEANRARPFFLELWHYAVHIPLRAKEEMVRKYRQKQGAGPATSIYGAMLESVDQSVGKVMKKLEELGIAEQTVVIFTSDNGGLSVREGTATPPTNNAPLRAGKGYLYEGGVRVPLIVRWPGVVKAGAVCSDPMSSPDFLPTFAEMAGFKGKLPENLDGVSILPLLKGKEHLEERPLYWHYPHYANQGAPPGSAMRLGEWKLIHWFEQDKFELFNLRYDVSETKDVSGEHPQEVKRLKRMLEQWRQTVGAQMLSPRRP